MSAYASRVMVLWRERLADAARVVVASGPPAGVRWVRDEPPKLFGVTVEWARSPYGGSVAPGGPISAETYRRWKESTPP